jgi:dihydroflavonol-4-reductase
MIIAVTGASGHIGANLVRSLIQEKRQVRALVHQNTEGIEGLDIEKVRGELEDINFLCKAFSGVEVVYHLAAFASSSVNDWKKAEAVNVVGTRNVVEACLQCDVSRLIHFSSVQALVQKPLNIPIDETRSLAEQEDHLPAERSKALAEREVRQGIERGLDAIILNPTGVLGPFDYHRSYFGEFILAIFRGQFPALIEGGFDWVDARDVVSAAIRAENLAPVGAKYLISGNWVSLRDLARQCEKITGSPAPRLVIPEWVARSGAPVARAFSQISRNQTSYAGFLMRAFASYNHQVSHERATRELNYKPRPLHETLADTFNWFQKTGILLP